MNINLSLTNIILTLTNIISAIISFNPQMNNDLQTLWVSFYQIFLSLYYIIK